MHAIKRALLLLLTAQITSPHSIQTRAPALTSVPGFGDLRNPAVPLLDVR
jgi:hypothetical protein